ncbi:hypothetical protein C8J57DRAFT_1089076 [Mycena rebaudengoi]|nr:hypothetical protein C8J57DRAFT_1089076 [Mycena rebaudengoi]
MSHQFFFIRRLARALTVFVVLAFILLALFRNDLKRTVVDPPEIRALGHPSFADIREYERQFTQHTLPSRGAARPRYLLIPGESWGSGWNNVFQEQLLSTHLGYISNRGYVFRDYTPRDHPPFPDTFPNGTRHFLSIPMNAMISGPTGGGPYFVDSPEDGPSNPPRAISREWWERVCPEPRIFHLELHATNAELGIVGETDAAERMMRWGAKLRSVDAECVSVDGGSIFDYMLIGGDRVLPVWKTYGSSPTLTAFAWSPLIARALQRNFQLLSSMPPPPHLSLTRSASRLTSGNASSPYPLTSFAPYRTATPPISGLLGLHIRRGDYEGHCNFLADAGADYNAWNAFGRPDLRNLSYPALPDFLDVPQGMSRRDAAHAHCWPLPARIVERTRIVRADAASGALFPAQKLTTVYISTNGEREWISALVQLLRADGWERISTSLDMELAKDEYAVSQVVDVSILVSAETFIGVGFSSMSSNVVSLRLSSNKHPATCRFW